MKITITGPVKRNGKTLPLDESISIPDAEAQALIDAGAAEPVLAKVKPEPDRKGKAESAVVHGKDSAEGAAGEQVNGEDGSDRVVGEPGGANTDIDPK